MLPTEIEGFLTKDEIVERQFSLKERRVFATNKRLIVKEAGSVRDFSYSHISSIEYKEERLYRQAILPLIMAIILGGIGSWMIHLSPWWGWSLIFGSIVAFLGGVAALFLSRQSVELSVIGLTNPIRFEGQADDLDSLLKIIREKR